MIKKFKYHCLLLIFVGWIGVLISTFGFVGDCALRHHYIKDGNRSKVSMSAYLQKLESEFGNGNIQKEAVFQQMEHSHKLLIDDILDYLLAIRLLLILLLCISIVVLSTVANQKKLMHLILRDNF